MGYGEVGLALREMVYLEEQSMINQHPYDIDAAVETDVEERQRQVREESLVEIQIKEERQGTPPEATLDIL